MVNHLDVHTLALFILSLPALRLSQFDAVHELTAILKFNIKPLTTSNGQHSWAFSFSRGQKGQIFHCTLRDFAKLTYQIQLKRFKIYLIKFDLTINYNRKRQHINVSKVSTHPSLINLNRPWCLTSQSRTQSLLAVWSAGQSSRRCPSDQKAWRLWVPDWGQATHTG